MTMSPDGTKACSHPCDVVVFQHPTRDKVYEVDACIAPIVKALNAAGVATIACCCGHGQQPASIILADGREIRIAPDHATARKWDTPGRPIHMAGPPKRQLKRLMGVTA